MQIPYPDEAFVRSPEVQTTSVVVQFVLRGLQAVHDGFHVRTVGDEMRALSHSIGTGKGS